MARNVGRAGNTPISQRSFPATSPTTQTASQDLLRKFQTEYPTAAAKLEEAYSHVKIDTTEELTADGKLLWTERLELWREAKAIRVKRNVLQSTDLRWPVGSFGSLGTDGTTCFDVYRLPDDKDFTFTQFGPDRDFEMRVHAICSPVFGAYCISGRRIRRLFETRRRSNRLG